MIEVIIGASVGALAVVRGYRLIAYARTRWRLRGRIESFERWMRAARDELSRRSFPWREATAGDAELVALLDGPHGDEVALAGHGFWCLGELVMDRPGGAAVMRVFVDAARTTCAMLTVAREAPSAVRLTLRSYGETEWFTTRRSAMPQLAGPPSAREQRVSAATSIADAIARHRAFVAGQPAQLDTIGELVARWAALREATAAWRAAQPSDELLDADLRSVLGENYARDGKLWARRLRDRLPAATLVVHEPRGR